MTTIELVIGQQQTAALTVADSIADYEKVLTTLSSDIQAQAAGFTGYAASGFAELVTAWFETATLLGPALQKYAEALVVVDTEHGKNESKVITDYTRLSGRLGGGA